MTLRLHYEEHAQMTQCLTNILYLTISLAMDANLHHTKVILDAHLIALEESPSSSSTHNSQVFRIKF